MGTKLTAGLTIPIVGSGIAMVKWAADLEQTLGATEHLWGSNADSMMDWARTADQALGMTQDEALTTANRLYGIYSQMGLSTDEVKAKTLEMTERFADLSALMGGTPIEAAEAYTSALMGNYQALDKYNININAAMVNQKALEMTGKDSVAQLSAEEKQLAFNALYLEKTADAQGQFEREITTTTGKLTRLNARLKNAATTFGNLLLPYVNRAADAVAKFATWLEDLDDTQRKWIIGIAAAVAAIGPLLIGIGMLLPGISALIGVLGFILSPIGLVVVAVALLVAGLTYAYFEFEAFRNIVNSVASAVKGVLIGAFDMAVEAFNKLRDAFEADGWTGLISTLGSMIWNGLSSVFSAIRNIDWGSLVQGGWEVIQAGIALAWNAITSLDWDTYIDPIAWASWIGGKIEDIGVWLWDKISGFFPDGNVITGVIAMGRWLWDKIGQYFPAVMVIKGAITVGTWLWGKIKEWFPEAAVISGAISDLATWVWGQISKWFPSANVISGAIADFGAWLYELLGSPTLSFPSIQDFKNMFWDWLEGKDSDFSDPGGDQPGQGGGGKSAFDFGGLNFDVKGGHLAGELDAFVKKVQNAATANATAWGRMLADATKGATGVQRVAEREFSATARAIQGHTTGMRTSTIREFSSMQTAVMAATQGMRNAVTQATAQMVSASHSSGLQMNAGLTSWLSGAVSQIAASMLSIVATVSAVAGTGYNAGYYAGSMISQGFASGMLSMLGTIRNAGNAMVAAASQAVIAKAMISSPSRLFEKYGSYVSEGFERGILGGLRDISHAGDSMVGAATPGAPALAGAQGPTVINHNYYITPPEMVKLMQDAEAGGAFARQFATELGMRG